MSTVAPDETLALARAIAAQLIERDPTADLTKALNATADTWLHDHLFEHLGVLRNRLHQAIRKDCVKTFGPKVLDWDLSATSAESESTRLARAAYHAALRSVLLGDVIGEPCDWGPNAPVGLTEIAAALRVEQQTAQNWRTRGVLPAPRWTVGGRPAWSWRDDIEPWARETGRLK